MPPAIAASVQPLVGLQYESGNQRGLVAKMERQLSFPQGDVCGSHTFKASQVLHPGFVDDLLDIPPGFRYVVQQAPRTHPLAQAATPAFLHSIPKTGRFSGSSAEDGLGTACAGGELRIGSSGGGRGMGGLTTSTCSGGVARSHVEEAARYSATR